MGDVTAESYIHSNDYIKIDGNCTTYQDIYCQSYLTVLDNIVSLGQIQWGNIYSGGILQSNVSILSSGCIIAEEYIHAIDLICAGDSIQSSESIFFCGGYIKSGSTISAGKDYGIYAGLYVKLSDMKNQGCIYSKYKPDNIISGHWHRIGG